MMTWLLIWLNRSVTTINATLQFIDIYKQTLQQSCGHCGVSRTKMLFEEVSATPLDVLQYSRMFVNTSQKSFSVRGRQINWIGEGTKVREDPCMSFEGGKASLLDQHFGELMQHATLAMQKNY